MKPTLPCPSCDGTGKVPDQRAIGMALRVVRKKARVGLNEIARRLSLSAPYLHDLEHGRRAWNAELEARYRKALKQKTTTKPNLWD